jgi:hypothetical protein
MSGETTVVGVRVPSGVVAAQILTLIVSLAYWSWLARGLWFYGDEWDFLTRRGVFHAQASLWAPHNEHWSTLPILLWRGIFSLVHLASYWPYLVPLLLAHLVVVRLVWRQSLHDGAEPWLATALGALLGLLGTGWEDVDWAFQIGFVGSLLFGLLAVRLADHPSGSLRRDTLISLLSVAALMCSTVGDAMLVAVAVVLVVRRGCGRAAGVLVLPVCVAALWWETEGRRGLTAMHDTFSTKEVEGVPGFVWTQFTHALGFGLVPLGVGVSVLLGAWVVGHLRLVSQRAGSFALLGAALAFYALAGIGRDRLGSIAPSRYIYIGMALMVPLLALALSWLLPEPRHLRGLLSRRNVLRALLGVLSVAIGASAVEGVSWMSYRRGYVRRDTRQILTSARLLAAGQPVINPYPFPGAREYGGQLTPADLLRLYRKGFLPASGPITETQRLYDDAWLDVELTPRASVRGTFALGGTARVRSSRPRPSGCVTFFPAFPTGAPPAVRLTLARGEDSATARLQTSPGSGFVATLELPPVRRWSPAASTPGEPLTVGDGGRARLDDAAPGAVLILELPQNAPTTLCGLAP